MFIIVTKHGSFVFTDDQLRLRAAYLVGCRVYARYREVHPDNIIADLIPLWNTPKFGSGEEESWTTTDDEMVVDAIAKS